MLSQTAATTLAPEPLPPAASAHEGLGALFVVALLLWGVWALWLRWELRFRRFNPPFVVPRDPARERRLGREAWERQPMAIRPLYPPRRRLGVRAVLGRLRSALRGRPVRYSLTLTHELPPGDHELRVANFEARDRETIARMKLARGSRS